MKTGIQFEADRLFDLGIDPHTLYPKVVRRGPKSLDLEKPLPDVPRLPQKVDTPPANVTSSSPAPDATSSPSRSDKHLHHHSLDGTLVEHHREMSVAQTDEQCGNETIHRTETSVIDEKVQIGSEEGDEVEPLHGHSKGRGTFVEDREDRLDAECPVYDQLKLNKWWWALELLPLRERQRQPDGTWKKKWM